MDTETRLYVDTVDAKPVDMDWQELAGEYGEGFSYTEATRCDDCGEIVTGSGYVEHECPGDGGGISGEFREILLEGPMMNYAYPLPDFPEALNVEALADLPLCLVNIAGSRFLALTGGGMDLSWEICEAFMRLGFSPPAHFARDLPAMAFGDDGGSDRRREIVAACVHSLEVQAWWDTRGIERLRELDI